MLYATDELDVDEVEGWLKRMVAEDDQRIQRLREITSEAPS